MPDPIKPGQSQIRRAVNDKPVRLEGKMLTGTAVPYNSLSRDIGGFQERFMVGAVADTIRSGTIEANAYHDPTKPLGSQAAGTLRLRDSADGLLYEIDTPDTSYGEDLRTMVQRGDVGGTSFAFKIPDPSGHRFLRESGVNIHEVTRATLQHISPVITPAYLGTDCALRSLAVAAEPTPEEAAELYGLDVQMLRAIFLALRKGLTLEEAELSTARRAVELLNSIPRPRLSAAARKAADILI